MKNIILNTLNKRPILYDVFSKENKKPCPLIIFSHGYKGFKDWGAWDLVAQKFTEKGINFLKFNFSHNGGTIENPIDFPDLEAFAKNTYSLELEDLQRIIDLVMSEDFQKDLPVSQLILMGHSRGGGVSIIKASEDLRIDKVVTWASVSDFRPRFMENTPAFEEWKRTGITYIENTRTNQQLPHYFKFYEDFIANKDRFSIEQASKHLKRPILVVHGMGDTTVTIKEAEALAKWNKNNSELFLIPDADHVFGAKHPWDSTNIPKDLETAIKKTVDFIKTV